VSTSASQEAPNGRVVDLWVSEAVLSWAPTFSSYIRRDDHPGRRQHEVIRHVDGLLVGNPSRDTLADAVEDINKAIDQRINRLNENYSLRELRAAFPGGDKYPEILAALGVIRPLMIEEINAIRNPVNHEDADPPGLDTCKRHAEFGWYFLRSTDVLTRVKTLQVTLEESARTRGASTVAQGRVVMRIEPSKGWATTWQASISAGLVQDVPTRAHVRVRVTAEEANSIIIPGGGIVANTTGNIVVFSAEPLWMPEQRRVIAELVFRVLADV
jgi:hypothetical protein